MQHKIMTHSKKIVQSEDIIKITYNFNVRKAGKHEILQNFTTYTAGADHQYFGIGNGLRQFLIENARHSRYHFVESNLRLLQRVMTIICKFLQRKRKVHATKAQSVNKTTVKFN